MSTCNPLHIRLGIGRELTAKTANNTPKQSVVVTLAQHFEMVSVEIPHETNIELLAVQHRLSGFITSHALTAPVQMPTEPLSRLIEPEVLEHFLVRVSAFNDVKPLLTRAESPSDLSAKELITYHSRYKYLVMAHSLAHYQSMGRLLGKLQSTELPNIAKQYVAQLMAALAIAPTRKTHTNTLMHIQGYLKKVLTAKEKAELTALIEQYRLGNVMLSAPRELLKKHLNKHPEQMRYVLDQAYITPYD